MDGLYDVQIDGLSGVYDVSERLKKINPDYQVIEESDLAAKNTWMEVNGERFFIQEGLERTILELYCRSSAVEWLKERIMRDAGVELVPRNRRETE